LLAASLIYDYNVFALTYRRELFVKLSGNPHHFLVEGVKRIGISKNCQRYERLRLSNTLPAWKVIMWKCINCGEENGLLNRKCFKCGTPKAQSLATSQVVEKPSSGQAEIATESPNDSLPTATSSGYITALKIFGWIALVAGIVGALIIYSNAPEYPPYHPNVDTRPYYMAAAVVALIQGIFFFVLCKVVAAIGETVIAIRNRLSS
jgi:hypothetical protein